MIKSTIAVSKSQCRLVLDENGRVALYTSTVEMGQGAHTVLAQIPGGCAEVPLACVSVGPDTAQTLFDSTTSASRSTQMMGNAVLNGVEELKRRLVQAAVPLFEQPPEQLAAGSGGVFARDEPEQRIPFEEILRRTGLAELVAQGEISVKTELDPETGQGVGSPHYHQGAGACEVEVDTQTGKVRVLRYCASSFAGKVVNPRLAELQNDGNVIFGMGPALMEEMVISEGQVTNPNLSITRSLLSWTRPASCPVSC
jgi:CO/xanthine dehydrogenase Mo-binding subunit